jgi:hypothetical protein
MHVPPQVTQNQQGIDIGLSQQQHRHFGSALTSAPSSCFGRLILNFPLTTAAFADVIKLRLSRM